MFAVIVASALVLPFFGPLLDHHFVERQPGHRHVYLDGAPAEHTHPYEIAHVHGKAAIGSAGIDGEGPGSNIIFLLPEGDGVPGLYGFGSILALLVILAALVIPPMLTQAIPVGPKAFRNITLPPEPPPPRAVL